MAGQKSFGAVEAAGVDRERACAEVFGAFDVVRRVANDYELFGSEIHLQVFANAVGGERGKIAPVVRLVAERARQWEEFRKTNQLHLQVSSRLDVSRQQCRLIAWVI